MASTIFESESGTLPARSRTERRARPAANPATVLKGVARSLSPAYRWVCSQPAVRSRLAPWLDGVPVDDFSPTGRGLGPEDGLRRLDKEGRIEGATVLIVGVGRGPEIERYWLDRGAAHVVGVDLFAYPDDWSDLRSDAAARHITASFGLMDGSQIAVRDASIDLIFSQSVLEHVLDLDAFLAESARVLSENGRFYAYFGPLWKAYGGPHVGALGYDHLLVDDEAYLEAARRVGGGWEHWLEHGLFNRLTFDEYLEKLSAHFEIERLGVVASSAGSAYRTRDPHTWQRLANENEERDLLTNLVSVVAKPRH